MKISNNLSLRKTPAYLVVEISKDVSPQRGFLYELCAGIIDKSGKTTEEIASMEVLEETGYKVSPEEFKLISRFR